MLKKEIECDLDFLHYGYAYEITSAMQTKPIRYTRKIYLTLLVCSAQMTLRQARCIKYFPREGTIKSDYFVMTLSVKRSDIPTKRKFGINHVYLMLQHFRSVFIF